MLTVIRKNQQVLMLAIAILTIISFIWLYNRTNLTQVGSNDVATVYGRVIQQAEIDRLARGYQLSIALGLTDFVKNLGGLGADEEASLNNFIVNLLVMQHQAPVLGIRPPDEEVASVIRTLQPLQTDGVFDPAKYARFLQEQLAPRGYTERQMEEIVRDSLKVAAIRRIVTSPVAVGENQITEAARIYQPVTGQILRFDREAFMKNSSASQDEVAAFYDKNKQGLQSQETRGISCVTFDLPVAQQKLSGKARTTALQKLADDAVTAGKTLREGIVKGLDFTTVAGKAALHPKKLEAVERDGTQNSVDSGLPTAVVGAAFRLQKGGEVSDIIQDGNTFYIVSVDGISPVRQLELAEVTDRIATLIKAQKASKALAEAAAKSLDQIHAAMTAGKSFADVAKQAGIKTQPFTAVTPSDSKNTQEQQAFATSSLGVNDGQLGPLQPAPWGAFAVYLEKRAPLTDAQWTEHKASLAKTLLTNEQDLLFSEWLNTAKGAAQIKRLNRRGGS